MQNEKVIEKSLALLYQRIKTGNPNVGNRTDVSPGIDGLNAVSPS